MTTPSIYRKWRPQVFADVVGQETVVHTLRQAVALGRVAHAYLFSGPRGTGKTSTARILAKALNCQSLAPEATPSQEDRVPGDPDNSCHFCQAVNEGRAFDVIEIDAASHRGIDDVRGLRERVFGSGPAEGRCKVYIIDEAHMLTEPAFNALLKTLEEPAPWAYFILCTTEVHKLPATIISRCQRFEFRSIAPGDTLERLETICQEEGVEWEPEALRAIARASWGSLRDACNVLEQSIISAGSPVTLSTLEALLGLSRDANSLKLARHALVGDVAQGLRVINDAATAGGDLRAFQRDVVEFLRAVLLTKSGVAEALDYPTDVLKEIQAMATETPWPNIFQAVKMFGQGNPRTAEAPSSLPLELALVECAQPALAPATPAPQDGSVAPTPARMSGVLSHVNAAPVQPTPPPLGIEPSLETSPQLEANEVKEPTESAPVLEATQSRQTREPIEPNVADKSVTDLQWESVCKALKRVRGNKYVLGSLLLDCRERYIEGDSLVLLFKNRANQDRLQDELDYLSGRQAVLDAVQAALGHPYTLRLAAMERQDSEEQSTGHLVRAAMALGAKIVNTKEETP